MISKVRSSTPILANQIHNQTLRTTKFITNLLKNGLGITDPSRKEVSALIAADGTNATEFYLSNMVSLRAQLGVSCLLFFSFFFY